MNQPITLHSRPIELLAPAKDLDCGLAAIDAGADAVYIGAPRFGARAAVGNSLEDIERLARHAHTFWARVYVTLNTLLFDQEIQAACDMAWQLYKAGVDGLIIQDAGLLECSLPPVPLIASTQMHNDTPEKIAFLEKVGFKRAIVARELSLEQIRQIRQSTSIELECFVHGALCVSYSGQCTMSYALGGRSGNRGQCAQPCRRLYDLVDSRGRVLRRNEYLLSLRDLNQTEHLQEMLEAGVSSFKIEGRLKDKAYVINIVSHYRAHLDAAMNRLGLRRSSSGISQVDFTPDPLKTFNREYSSYFLHGRGEAIAQTRTPKMIGEPVGVVSAVKGKTVSVKTELTLAPGDGITYFNSLGELQGTVINAAQPGSFVPDKLRGIRAGTMIYRNHDHAFLTRLDKCRPQRRIDVWLRLSVDAQGWTLSARDKDGKQAQACVQEAPQPALNPQAAQDSMRRQLEKTGQSDFACAGVELDLCEPVFAPLSLINRLRREALEALGRERLARRPVEAGGPVISDDPYPAAELGFEANVVNAKAREFYRRHGVKRLEPGAESGLDMRGRRVMTTRYCLKHQLELCPKQGGKLSLAEPLFLVDEQGNRFQLGFNCAQCQMEISWMGGGSKKSAGERPHGD